MTFSVPIGKEVTGIDKKEQRNHKNHSLQITIY